MEVNKVVQPQSADGKVFEGDGGGYYVWSNEKSPLLSEAKVGAAKLVLQPLGFALPHYSDSAKIGYVLQGCCTVGMVSPDSPEENILLINKGDIIPVPIGAVSWWFNGGDTDMVILFLGETSKAYTPGQFTYFFLTGTLGILGGFSTQFVSKAFGLDQKESEKLANSQKGTLIIKLGKGISFPEPNKGIQKLYTSIDNACPEVVVKGGGILITLTESRFPLLGEVGLSAKLVKLEANAMFGPIYTADGSVEVVYVTKGSGKVEVVGSDGNAVLSSNVKAGEMFIVPNFLSSAKIADKDGMELFSVITSSRPVIGELAGNTSVWKALSSVTLQTALSVNPKFEELFKSKLEKSTVIIPPNK